MTKPINAQRLSTLGAKWNEEAWAMAHRQAATCPRPGFELALAALFTGWLGYAETHQAEYESGIGKDGVLGEHWAQIGAGLRGLLNGSLGRFDGGTLDGLLADTLRQQGFDPDRL